MSLARKYRPARFGDMVGQDAVSRALSNAIGLGRIPHGVIFSGVRGIGKTTTARLYAKALNCEASLDADPCGQCESCVAISEGRHEDVLEIDGASHTGVDDIRALQETLEYVAQRSRYKVYIIDEVHMLSQSAFNALLKTLEEPPKHVIFIFATTELHKVPETILSRCQTFHLKRLSIAAIMERLRYILETEHIDYELHALALVAKEGRGSMRDALTFLDQAVAVGNGRLSMDTITKLLAYASSKPFLAMLEYLLKKDADSAMKQIASWDEGGSETLDLVEELIGFVRHSFVVRDLGRDALSVASVGLDPDEFAQLASLAESVADFECNRLFRSLVQCRKDLDGSEMDRYIFENYVMEWCLDPGLPDLSDWSEFVNDSSQKSITTPKSSLTERFAKATKELSFEKKNDDLHTKAFIAEPLKPALKEKSAKDLGLDLRKLSKQAKVDRKISELEQFTSSKSPESSALDREPLTMHENSQESFEPKSSQNSLEALKQGFKAKNSELPPIQVTEEQSQAASEISSGWPFDWRSLVERWKVKKPLQARLLEEVHPLHYSKQLIHLKLDAQGMAASKLLHSNQKQRLLEAFHELFGFEGELRIETLETSNQHDTSTQNQSLPETILITKQREKEAKRELRRNELFSHKITREIIDSFDATIRKVSWNDTHEDLIGEDHGFHQSGEQGNPQ